MIIRQSWRVLTSNKEKIFVKSNQYYNYSKKSCNFVSKTKNI